MILFIDSFIVTIIGIILAYFWGEHVQTGSGFVCVFIALILGILEISLSFDNAVVNAMKLEKMSPKRQHRFITWGILIAVFGMRFLFPLAVVSVFAGLNLTEVLKMALNDVHSYEHYLELTHAPIVTFGGAFLLMLFIEYFTNPQKDVFWLEGIEKPFNKLSGVRFISTIVTTSVLGILVFLTPDDIKQNVLIFGVNCFQ